MSNLAKKAGVKLTKKGTYTGTTAKDKYVGKYKLTPRQYEIAMLFRAAPSCREIMKATGLCQQSVKFHLSGIYEKLGISTRSELVRMVLSEDLTK